MPLDHRSVSEVEPDGERREAGAVARLSDQHIEMPESVVHASPRYPCLARQTRGRCFPTGTAWADLPGPFAQAEGRCRRRPPAAGRLRGHRPGHLDRPCRTEPSANLPGRWEVDHRVPLEAGGSNALGEPVA